MLLHIGHALPRRGRQLADLPPRHTDIAIAQVTPQHIQIEVRTVPAIRTPCDQSALAIVCPSGENANNFDSPSSAVKHSTSLRVTTSQRRTERRDEWRPPICHREIRPRLLTGLSSSSLAEEPAGEAAIHRFDEAEAVISIQRIRSRSFHQQVRPSGLPRTRNRYSTIGSPRPTAAICLHGQAGTDASALHAVPRRRRQRCFRRRIKASYRPPRARRFCRRPCRSPNPNKRWNEHHRLPLSPARSCHRP